MNKSKLICGTLLVLFISISSIVSTQLAKFMQNPGFDCPFFIIWLNTSWISLLLIPPLCKGRDIMVIWEKDKMNIKKLLLIGFFFCCLWIIANYCYVAALSRVNSSAIMAIFSSNYAFVYILSLYFLKDQICLLPFIALLLSIAGILLLSLSSSIIPSLLPLLLTLTSSFIAALYKVLLKLFIPTASMMTISSFLGVIGITNSVFFWGFWLGFENVRHNIPWNSLIFSGINGLFYNSLINFGIVYTYPMFIAVGVGLAMPGNMIWDVLGNDLAMENQQIFGSVMIIAGFGCIVLEGYRNAVREAEKRRKEQFIEESTVSFRETTSP